ncbi:MAG: hypothetical protein KGL38_11150 [Gemmatimonadota bacterium]|nr:hypothetical protein [Gemmatimonadota bacterium]MDE3172137.1 hypothetical protein [Gemmatimonadota bacterium]
MRQLRLLALLVLVPATAAAQGLDLTVNHVGLALGNVPRVTGLRLNFRDSRVQWVNGINATVWNSYREPTGAITGLVLGLPLTDGRRIRGLALGAGGVGAADTFTGIGAGGLGVGAGGNMRGLFVGGLGVGTGGSIHGLAVGGLGAGSAGGVEGIAVGGLGVGTAGVIRGIAVGGVGAGAGGGIAGVVVGGIGAGTGGSMTGIGIGGIGVGSAGDFTGVGIAGIGVGSGERIRGVALAGIGVGAPRIEGVAVGGFGAGAESATGALVAGGYTRLERGRLDGLALSPYNDLRGHLHGLSVGVVNYAWTIDGLQLGLINIVRDNPAPFRVLPVVNWHHD